MPEDRWPQRLWLARHGESAGNVARDKAEASGAPLIDIAQRDMDVALSALGEQQARALGRWLGTQPPEGQPTVVLTSPYRRACATAELTVREAGLDGVPVVVDERLREREFGILDRLTRAGIEQRYPEQAAARAFLGKFYHRPPGGESWADVALRVRSAIDSVGREYGGERVLAVAHQVVILVFRFVLERLDEEGLLAIDREAEIANCSITELAYDPDAGRGGGMRLVRYNEVEHLKDSGEPVTTEPDAPLAPR